MCSQQGTINVLRKVIENRAQQLAELRAQKTITDEAIASMEQSQTKDMARLKELENDNK